MAPWALWLIGAVVVAAAETLSGDFFLLMIATGALAGGGAAVVGAPPWLQIIVFAVVSVLMIATVRPIAKRAAFRNLPDQEDGARAYVGRVARVSQPVDAHGGRIKLGEDEWSALALAPHDQYPVGQSVRIVEIRGAHAVVAALEAFED